LGLLAHQRVEALLFGDALLLLLRMTLVGKAGFPCSSATFFGVISGARCTGGGSGRPAF
jgi:hypothetical protein